MGKRKYIILKDGQPILFSTVLNHYDVAQRHGGKENVRSAGFWSTNGTRYSCFGGSYTLGIDSDSKEDSELLTRYFGDHGG